MHIPLGGSAVHRDTDNNSPLCSPGGSGSSSPYEEHRSLPLFVPEVEEIRISPVISRKGYLTVLDNRTNTWIKRWVVCIIQGIILKIFCRCFDIMIG